MKFYLGTAISSITNIVIDKATKKIVVEIKNIIMKNKFKLCKNVTCMNTILLMLS